MLNQSLFKMVDSDVKIDVCVLNPSEETSVQKISRKYLKQIDLYTNLSIEKNGNPVLTVGCSLNGSWVPMTYQKPYKWWDRLSKKPKRFYYKPEEPIYISRERVSKGVDYEYCNKLATLPKRYTFKPDETKHKTIFKNNGEQNWWDRLSILPTRKIMYRQCIYQKYEILLHNLKNELNKKIKKYQVKEKKAKTETEKVESMTDIRDLLQLELDEVKGNLSLSFDGLSVIQEECEELFTSQRDSQQSIKKEEVEKKEEDKIDEQENTSLDNEDLERTLENSIIAVEEVEESNDEASGNKIVEDEKRQSIKIEEDSLERSILEQERNDVDFTSPLQKYSPRKESEIDTNELLADLDLTELSDLDLNGADDFTSEDILEVGVLIEDGLKEKKDEEEETANRLTELEVKKKEEEEKQKLFELEAERLKQEEKEEKENLKEEDKQQKLSELKEEEETKLKDEEQTLGVSELEARRLQEELTAKQKVEEERKTKNVRVIRPEGQPWWERLSKPRRNIPQYYITYIPPIKVVKRNKYWLLKSNENWVDRLSKPRRPVIKREIFKPQPLLINKNTNRLLERRRKNYGNNDWWNRLSKPRQTNITE